MVQKAVSNTTQSHLQVAYVYKATEVLREKEKLILKFTWVQGTLNSKTSLEENTVRGFS